MILKFMTNQLIKNIQFKTLKNHTEVKKLDLFGYNRSSIDIFFKVYKKF